MAKCWDVGTKEKSKRQVILVQGKRQEIERNTKRTEPVIKQLIIASTHLIAGNISIYKEVYRGRGKHEYSCTVGNKDYTGFKNIEAVKNWLAMHLWSMEQNALT